ncbi:DUF5134 domain-containing protein [Nocardia sp. CA-129566]|uniref:DUF5134 domain-containing protein n=1 Tax=Nocardia sp. CA-129566 TaxID=3239976 RepID=UPI003D966B56
MVEFAQEYAALRWSVVVAFLFAAAVVLGRLAAPAREMRRTPGQCGAPGTAVVPLVGVGTAAADSLRPQAHSIGQGVAACHESDAAHLIMCLVMLAMLVFPAGANPVALRGVLIAMIVVFAALLVDRIVEWRSATRLVPGDRMVALGYHILVAVAMLYAISGHGAGGHTGGPMPIPALALATLFAADAIALIIAASTGRRQRWLGHPIAPPPNSPQPNSFIPRTLSSAMVPHLVMDLGTTYMLIAAIST